MSKCWRCGGAVSAAQSPSRVDGSNTEYECVHCGTRNTFKGSDPDPYVFWPADIDASLDNDVKPLFV